jgi:predicted nucleic acid-binding protein
MARRTEAARKVEAYVDTSALIAFLDRSDSHHPLFRRLFADPPPLVTSALVVVEGHGWFLRRYDNARAIQFLNFIDELSPLSVQPFDEEELRKASRLIKRFADQKLTLADAHGLVIMGERRGKRCWSTDRHLGLTGVELVI